MEKPIGKAILLCDQVIEDLHSRKKTLVGIFSKVFALQFPVVHNNLSVYIALTNGSGPLNVKLQLRADGPHDSPPIFEAEGNVRFENPSQVVELIFNLLGLPFEKPGQYSFEVYANDEYIFETKFDVVKLPSKPSNPNPRL